MLKIQTTYTAIIAATIVGFSGCKKGEISLSTPTTISNQEQVVKAQEFTPYLIPKGQHSCTTNGYAGLDVTSYQFQVYFDSSAIYELPATDQDDINKLSGFSDNGAVHLQYSARFGWRWSNNHLRLFGFVHNSGKIIEKEICIIEIGKTYTCGIRITKGEYVFTVDELKKTATIPRSATTATSQGYRLYPYFGGNNVAPHEIRIWIKY